MALYEEFSPQPNRLINAKSAYLRSAAYQPIGWYEYGPEAFAEARLQDKPLLLDIGAIWCHWCHVIDRESYDDPDIATLINELYIPVKVDRDERPDIDARYQTAVQLLTGQGGWPLTVFLTPEGSPFYGGTYFPPDDRYGRMGLRTVLPRLADAYTHRRQELEEIARSLTERTRQTHVSVAEAKELSERAFRRIADGISKRFDAEQGGFEHRGPKFPHAGAIELALLQWYRTGEEKWRTVVETTLQAMGRGGLYDQLGGGFHRYATDATWTVPHFEKMSFDNALLLENYAHAARALDNEFFREIALGTLTCILRDFADHDHGGFYGSQDADISLNDDGSYWTWTIDEFTEPLSPEETEPMLRYYGVTPQGDLPDSRRNVLHVNELPAAIATSMELPIDEVLQRIERGKRKLLEVRRHRKTPRVDTNKYTGWNGLLIAACLEAGTLLDQPEARDFALRSVEAVLHDGYDDIHGFSHVYLDGAGARVPGILEDQVYMARALLAAFAVSGERRYLDTARHLVDLCIEKYWDEAGGGFLDVERDIEEHLTTPFLRQPRKVIEDLPTPAPNAVLALVLDRLWLLTQEERYRELAERTLETFAGHAPDYGPFAAFYGLAVYYHQHPPLTVTVIGDPAAQETQALRQTALESYRPGKLVASYPPDAPALPYPLPAGTPAAAYVCVDTACTEPATTPEALGEQLRTFGAPR